MSEKKLNSGQKHLLNLIESGMNADGWATVSEMLFPVFKNTLPAEIIILEKLEKGGRAKLTEKGEQIVMAMKYF